MRVDQTRILEEAVALANRNGLDGLSMNDLAQALSVRTPSLYSHVKGLDEVKRMLALHGLDLLERGSARATMGKSGGAAVKALMNAYRAFAEGNPGVYAATVPTPPRSDREWSGAVDRLMATFIAALQTYEFRGPDTIHALRALRSLVHGFVSLEGAGALKHPVERDESFAWLVDSFLSTLDRAAPPRSKKLAGATS